MQQYHHLVKQTRYNNECLEYADHETELVAHMITKHRKENVVQQYMMRKGLKVFGNEGPPVCKVGLQ